MKRKKRFSSKRRNECQTKEIQKSAVLEVADLTAEHRNKLKDRKKSCLKAQDTVQPSSTTTSKIPSCSSSVEIVVVSASKSVSVSLVKVGKKQTSTVTVMTPFWAPDISNSVPVPKKRKLMKTAKNKVKMKMIRNSKSGVPKEKEVKEDRMSQSAGKTSCHAINKSIIAGKVCATQKDAAATNFFTTDSFSGFESCDFNESTKSMTTSTLLLPLESVSIAPPVTDTSVSDVMEPPPKNSHAEDTSDGFSNDSDGNP